MSKTSDFGEPKVGVLEWLRPGEHQRALELLVDLRKLGVTQLRTGLSWADWHTSEGKEWFDWLIPTIARQVELLPCFTYTPPSLGCEAKTSAPPREAKWYADFIDTMLQNYGEHFEWIELWNEPNNLNDWDWRLDPNWEIFSDMMGMAAHWAKQQGKKTVLAGMCPTDPNWLDLMGSRGLLQLFDAVGIHGFPGTWEFDSDSWATKIQQVRGVLAAHNSPAEIWLTETGYSTWRHDDITQIQKFIDAVSAPVQRVYWYSAYDLHPHESHQDGFHEDERHYHFGFKTAKQEPKLLYRIWQQRGIDGLRKLVSAVSQSAAGLSREPLVDSRNMAALSHTGNGKAPVLITGGAGFVGTNVAKHQLEQGERVLIFDSLAREGVEQNLAWLCDQYGERVQLEVGDIRDAHLVRNAVQHAHRIYHFAAQVAVTTSLENPLQDFDVNVRGTLNVLEAMRTMAHPPPMVFTSTNKVYGALDHIELARDQHAYTPSSRAFAHGVNESQRLDFYSPYGCSKGAADQYVLDYARSFGLPTAVLRMSCIYGEHQFGTEDQGWVAHFMMRVLRKEPLMFYGDGYQVRDILYVGDLVRAMLVAQSHMNRLRGRAFNIGGGPANAVSLRELLKRLEAFCQQPADIAFSDWRPGDQKYYVSDTRLFQNITGWQPRTSVDEGLQHLWYWLDNGGTPAPVRNSLADNARQVI